MARWSLASCDVGEIKEEWVENVKMVLLLLREGILGSGGSWHRQVTAAALLILKWRKWVGNIL